MSFRILARAIVSGLTCFTAEQIGLTDKSIRDGAAEAGLISRSPFALPKVYVVTDRSVAWARWYLQPRAIVKKKYNYTRKMPHDVWMQTFGHHLTNRERRAS